MDSNQALPQIRFVQGTTSPGFGGLEMVIIEFHEWLLSKNIEAFVIAYQNSPLEKKLIEKGFRDSTVSVPEGSGKDFVKARRRLDSPQTAMLFHRQQGLKQLRFRSYQSKVTLVSHTFYGVQKKDFLHRWIFNKVDQWIALTERHKNNIIETCGVKPEKIKIVPNGVNLERFKMSEHSFPENNEILNIGILARLDPKKGQDLAVHALKLLLQSSKRHWKLHLYGIDTPNEEPYSPKLKSLIASLKLQAHVEFHGHSDDLDTALKQLDVLWMPSEKETFGRCILEGMATGVPVIASDAGGVPDIINHGQNGLLFKTGDPSDLCEKTLELFADQALYRQIQISARRDVEVKYDQNKIWEALFCEAAPATVFIVDKAV